jgi:SAM-dependent methyltransferase
MMHTLLSGGFVLLLLIGIVEFARVRRKLKRFSVLLPSADDFQMEHQFLVAPGVTLNDRVRRAASAYLEKHRLEVLDLLPENLAVEPALEILGILDPDSFASDPFSRGAGGGYAIIATHAALRRSGISAIPADRAALSRCLFRLKRAAPYTTMTVIAPGLKDVAEPGSQRTPLLVARYGMRAHVASSVAVVKIAWAFFSLWFFPELAVTALVLFQVSPLLIFVGGPITPQDRWVSLAVRGPRYVLRWVRGTFQDDGSKEVIEQERPAYAELLRYGLGKFFRARREDCLLCGSRDLQVRLKTTDLMQRKPGHFALERCGTCGHIFQNPQLSPEGLHFYYRDFYDGLSADFTDEVFGAMNPRYKERIRLMNDSVPQRWLDIGAGFGHFCLAARHYLAATRFEGLDQGAAVEEAKRRGWLHESWRGTLLQYEDSLRGCFDAASMFHYLEHTTDPREQLRAAAQVLRPGGRLIVEVPNPECRIASLLGRWWTGWFQPQHLHFLTADGMKALLLEVGFIVSKVEYCSSNDHDILLAALRALEILSPHGDVPWRSRPPAIAKGVRAVIGVAGIPLLVTAVIADAVHSKSKPSRTASNAYRIVAERA